AEHLGEPAEALIGQRHHPDVRLDGGERVVRREHGRTGEGVEERRLAHVGQAGDTDSQGHGSPVYGRNRPVWTGRSSSGGPAQRCSSASHTPTTSPAPILSARCTTAFTGSRYRPSLGNSAVANRVRPIRASTATWPQYSSPRAASLISAEVSGSMSTK